MATGYTYDVVTGKLTSFRKFALRCARAFTVCIEQRDDPMDDPPKKSVFREDSYSVRHLKECEDDLAKLRRMSVKEAAALREKLRTESIASWRKTREEWAAENARTEAMLMEVERWRPPTDEHVRFKLFMMEQLTTSLHDLSFAERYEKELDQDQSIEDWLKERIQDEEKSVERAKADLAREEESVKKQNAWIDALYESLAR